jgi:hypothetical protein
MDKILDNADPTIQEVKEWGYDEQTSFIEQDEDLILHAIKYITVLIELASDSNCPKNDYCLSILTHFSQQKLVRRESSDVGKIEKQIEEYHKQLPPKVEKWKSDFLYLSNFIKKPQTITEPIADKIAFNLTVGDYCIGDFKKLGIIEPGVIEYLASTISYKEYFYIELKTSYWRSSKYSRLDKI